MSFWDWKTGHRFQSLDTTAQPGSLEAEAGLFTSTFDRTGLRLICGEADKTSKTLADFPQTWILMGVCSQGMEAG
jgi:pleiotropic regulator 1